MSDGCGFRKGEFLGMRRNGREAPIPVILVKGSNSGFNTIAAVRRPRDIGPVTTWLEYLRNDCSILGRHGVTEPTEGVREPSRGRAHYWDSEKASTHRGGN